MGDVENPRNDVDATLALTVLKTSVDMAIDVQRQLASSLTVMQGQLATVLAGMHPVIVHYNDGLYVTDDDQETPLVVCGRTVTGRHSSTNPADATCKNCKETLAYKQAARSDG